MSENTERMEKWMTGKNSFALRFVKLGRKIYGEGVLDPVAQQRLVEMIDAVKYSNQEVDHEWTREELLAAVEG